jgi:SNF2 family DNA or RNA helicase
VISTRQVASFLHELTKLALVQTELQPHQARVVERMKRPDQPGLVVAHGLGSGKTLTSIAAQEALEQPASVVVPAALQDNYAKEVQKHTTGPSPARHIQSMQNVAGKQTQLTDPMMIVDEAHRAREMGTKTYQALAKNQAQKRMLLTGSPFYNHPADIGPLVNLAAGQRVLPGTRQDFARQYISERKVDPGFWGRLRGIQPGVEEGVNPQQQGKLKGILNKWVDYHPSSSKDFPSVKTEDVRVPMTPQQLDVYDTLLNRAPPWVSWKVRNNLPPSKQESKQLNAFLGAARQAANTTAPFQQEGRPDDPKIQRAFQELQKALQQNDKAKAVVYSNFLKAGLDPYRQRLRDANIPYGEFTGEQPKHIRDDLVRQYNEGKIRALLLSSAGGEGLDLKGTRLMQILEPHWNQEKLHQIEGRGVRFRSHADLPPEDQNVRIQRFLATRPKSGLLERLSLRKPGGSVDEYLSHLSSQKERLNDEFRQLLAQRQQGQAA